MTKTTAQAETVDDTSQLSPEQLAEAELLLVLKNDGYSDVKRMPEGTYAGLFQFMYTWAIMAELPLWGCEERWCYHSYERAKEAFAGWDGTGEPDGWHRHPGSGRRRSEDGIEAGVW